MAGRRTTMACVVAAALAALTPRVTAGQDAAGPACAYDECSLRVRFGFFGETLVRGTEGQHVRSLDFWIGSLDDVFEGSEPAQALAASFRRRHNTGTVLTLLGLAVLVAGASTDDDWWNDPGATLWIGLGFGVAGSIAVNASRDPLSRAVWTYNRALTR